ncbi:bleomycin resistance protein [Adhaeribacter aerolatus]|uniref:Bleomycin resistance protein n=1 Tax=Adhaeribacter aerolatus TaxID=670289 RepID=A0A512ATL7_9BACT|nr:VOC family protein [Adhaeribacter aerolatus]GEO03052.1 bleomycin resistance protein [Adhaeribacter aerolatus]
MQFQGIKETCLYVSDLARTKEFYHGRLGFELIGEVPGRHVFFRVGSSVLLCFISEASEQSKILPPHYGQGNLHLAFETAPEDYDSRKAEIEALGIPVELEYDWGHGFKSFYFRDPDGHLLEVVMTGMWDS